MSSKRSKKKNASKQPSMLPTIELEVASIEVPVKHRAIREKKMSGLMDSIGVIGLQTPISVRKTEDGYELVAGGHRLEAVKRMGGRKIAARILERQTCKLWASSENLHRAELTKLERAEELKRYARARERQVGRNAQPQKRGGTQPADRGHSALARECNIDRRQVRESLAHADISERAKRLLRKNGLDNTATVLTAVAKIESEEEQVAYVKKLRSPPTKQSDPTVSLQGFTGLWSRWERLKFRRRFEGASNSVKQRFIDRLKTTTEEDSNW
jgi:ParB/RepB/Spo0J family partition protein